MNKRETIQRVFALVLLLVAVLSATPKQYLHDLVADHTDCYTVQQGEGTTASKAGPNCHCEDLVVSTPFVQTSFAADFSLAPLHTAYITSAYQQFNLVTQYTKDLRGPPAVA